VADRPLIWVGIDVGKATHHACGMDPAGKVVFSRKVANDQAAIEDLVVRAGQCADEVRWAIDLTSSTAALLTAVLVASGQQVVYVPGRVVNRMTGVFRGETKSDAKDARVIAETARMRTDLTPVTATDDLVVELTRLSAHREDLMADWVRGVNRLRDLLTGIFPALERAFDYSTRSALILVTGFQTPDAIRDAGIAGVAEFLREQQAWPKGIPGMAATALAAADEQTLRLPGEATTAVLIARMARQLLDLDRQIKDTDKLITGRFRAHPHAEIIESLPGLGPILGTEFLVATGGTLTGFATAGRLASYAGLVPVAQDSGRITGNLRRPKRYNRRLRRVFYMAALSSIRANGPSRTFYDRKRGERLIHTQALLALARRLVDVL
jgi:transposase